MNFYFCFSIPNCFAMTEETKMCFDIAREGMDQALQHLDREFHKIRAGKADPSMLDSIKVEYYGALSPLNQVSGVTTPDPRSILIQPWDKNMIGPIEKAILAANLGFNPQNDGIVVRINVPVLTEERRRDLVKQAKHEAETARVSVRNIRRQANEEAKSLEKNGIAEDEIEMLQKVVQDLTNKYIEKVDKLLEAKEKDIMTV
jgi:ribosome recycling factor